MRKLNRPDCPDESALRTNYRAPVNKTALIEASHGKCMYCESRISHVYFGDIEHIKPKSKFPGEKYDWNNLGFCCAVCNNRKGDKYPEPDHYINPYEDNPSDYFVARDCFLSSKQGNVRADITIIDIDLNRPELIERRKEKLDDIEKFLKAAFLNPNESLKKTAVNQLKIESKKNKEYSFFIKTLMTLHEIE